MNDSTLADAALWYVENGFAVFPLQGRDKRPATKNGLNDWTDNPEDVRKYWSDHPLANIGIVCGVPSGGLLVLDIDVDEETGENGLHTLYEWERTHGELPETAVAVTGRGGLHYFYRTNRTNMHPFANRDMGIDLRTDGSYVVAAPSVHPNGRAYAWQDPPDETPIAVADGNVYDLIDHLQRNGGGDETRKDGGGFRLPDTIRKGERNGTLHSYACQLQRFGRSDEEIMATVMGANFLRCKPPLDSSEVAGIVKSALRYDKGASDSDERIGAPGAHVRDGGKSTPFVKKGGRVDTQKLGQHLIDHDRARMIDGAPAIWTGRHWEFGTWAISRAALRHAIGAKKQDKTEVISYVQDMAPRVTSDGEFDGRQYVQFSDVTVDVSKPKEPIGDDELTPDMLIVGSLSFPYKQIGDTEKNDADRFLKSISDEDKDIQTVLLEIAGACMCSSRIISQSPMLVGRADGGVSKAANGKSTYINFLRSMLGSQNYASMDIATLGQRFQAGMLVGKLANLGDDIPDGFLQGPELSTFKKLVTGDSIYTDVKNARGFEFRPNATMVFSMNTMPGLSDITDGIMRRLAFVPFRRKFLPGMDGYDPDMGKKLAAIDAMQRCAALALEKMPALVDRRALTRLPDMDEEINEVRRDNDSVVRWIEEECVDLASLNRVPVTDEYRRYEQWCRDGGALRPVSRSKFSKRVVGVTNVTDFGQLCLTVEPVRVPGMGKTARCFVFKEK